MGTLLFFDNTEQTCFIEKLDAESLAYFNEVASRPFAQQAVAFLNAYWPEVHEEAEFVFSVAWDRIKYADMLPKVLISTLTLASTFTSSFASSAKTRRTRSGPSTRV